MSFFLHEIAIIFIATVLAEEVPSIQEALISATNLALAPLEAQLEATQRVTDQIENIIPLTPEIENAQRKTNEGMKELKLGMRNAVVNAANKVKATANKGVKNVKDMGKSGVGWAKGNYANAKTGLKGAYKGFKDAQKTPVNSGVEENHEA